MMKSPSRLFPLLLSLLGSVVLSAEPASNPAAKAVPRNDWMAQHEGFSRKAKQGGVEVLFLGDSITNGWSGNGRSVWAKNYEPLKAANFGIGGDRTQHVLWRVQNGNLDGITPKVVVLMIGTNNPDSAPQIAEGIAAIVSEIRTRSPATKVLLLGVFPRGEKADTPARAKISEINTIIAGLDDGQKVFFLDIGRKFTESDGTISKTIMPDFLHLSPAGYQIWADAMEEKLAELLK